MRIPSRDSLQRFSDIAIPLLVGGFFALIALDESVREDSPLAPLVIVLVGVLPGVALYWRRRRPELVLAINTLASVPLLLSFELVIPFGALFALWSVAAQRPLRVSLAGLAAVLAVSGINFVTVTTEDAIFTVAVVAGVWALGEAARSRRVAIEEGARRAVSEEQARIARELHDVIAHSVSVIVVQASAADDVFDSDPPAARAALRSIERAGREALAELRRLLAGVHEQSTGPQPSLERVDELADPLRAGGLEVVVRREGVAASVPAGVDLSAYRIVQEALTNTLRHARATRAEVVVRYEADAVEVDVRDDGRSAPGPVDGGGGHGLVGMRERASLVGGTLDAGPLPRGGYRVHARLPLDAGT